MKRRIVVTGLGAVTAAGEGAAPLWEAVTNGCSGIDYVSFYEGSSWKPIGAAVKDFNPEKYVAQRKALKVMARDIQLAVAAAALSLDDSGARSSVFDRTRFGVIVGSGVLNHELDELAYSVQNSLGPQGRLDLKKFGEDGLPALFPLWLLKYLPNMSACHVSILFDLQGPNNTITTGASSGLQAIGEACRIIERGAADLMLAGGAESKLNPVGLSHYQVLGVLSEAEDDPKKTYKPFDTASRGLVVGEGAGFLMLEELEHAKRRGARIYAEIAGFGSSSVTGQKEALRAALADARVSEKEVGYIQASGLGLEADDMQEAEAIEEVFCNGTGGNILVSASKPVVGFTGFSAGPVDAVISTLALWNQVVPPVVNFNKPRRGFKFRIVADKPVKAKFKNAVTNTFGFGGQCASLVMGRL